jgi:Bacteriophage holin of superfamily 6 (Holin_LLH)
MMQEIVKVVADSIVEVLVLSVLSFGSLALAKAKQYLKSKTTEKQYDMLVKISQDVYDYVEREFGDKLQEQGQKKLERAMQVFDAQMQKHNLPYSSVDFKLQVEKIIKQEKQK